MQVDRGLLGRIDGQEVWEVSLTSDSNMEVRLISYGAAIRQIRLPGRNGDPVNIVLGFENWEDYIGNPLFAGAVLCPSAGRISGPRLDVDGRRFILSDNDGGNNLHGGFHCASQRVWKLESTEAGEDFCSVTFSVILADGEDGFPGNRIVKICYTLRNRSELELSFTASSDRATYFNLSGHSYFNLSGDFSRSGLEQILCVHGDRYVANDSRHIPAAVKPCRGTPFDFRKPVSPAGQMAAWSGDSQLANALGYNNALLLDAPPDPVSGLREALTLEDSASGRSLTLRTDAPCVVLYSGGYIGNEYRLCGGAVSSASCALALEAQDLPDAPNFAPESCAFTGPGQCYRRTIVMRLGGEVSEGCGTRDGARAHGTSHSAGKAQAAVRTAAQAPA